MKTTIISALLLINIWLPACQAGITADKVPALVSNSFKVRFAEATEVEWAKTGNLYEVEFMVQGHEVTALLDASGKILKHKEDILLAALPEGVKNALNQEYKNYKTDDIEKLDTDGSVYYQVELENADQELKQVFTTDGKPTTAIAYWD